MATASLTRFTVPLGNGAGQSSSAQGLIMPKLKYRFRINFINFGVSGSTTELTKQVIDFKRPSLSFEEKTIDVYNSIIKYAGRYSWASTTVNVRDDAQGSISKLVGEQIQKQFDFMEQSSASSGIDYKFQLDCEILDGGNGANAPTVLETWQLYGCYLSSVDYAELTYNSSDPVSIQMNVQFDNALQVPLGNGIGTSVGRTLGTVITG